MRTLVLIMLALSVVGCRLPKGPTAEERAQARVAFFTAPTIEDAQRRMTRWLHRDPASPTITPAGPDVDSAAELRATGYLVVDPHGEPYTLYGRGLPDDASQLYGLVTTRTPLSRAEYVRLNDMGLLVGGVRATQTYPVFGPREAFVQLLESRKILGIDVIAPEERMDPALGRGVEKSWKIHVHARDHTLYRSALDALGAHRLPGRSYEPVIRIYPNSVPIERLLAQPWIAYVAREANETPFDGAVVIPGPESIVESTRYYTVRGDGRKELVRDLASAARQNELPGRALGLTQLNWAYRFESRPFADGHRVTFLAIDGTSVITLPRWNRSARADAELVAEWNEFSHQLLEHELQHQRINTEMLADFRRRVAEIPPQPSFEELEVRLQMLFNQVLREVREEHAVFHRVDRLWEETSELLAGD